MPVPKMANNGFSSYFCLLAFDLGLFGEQLLAPRQDATHGFQRV
jgi:hypothetical protein